jgi:RNA recognition motif-containing protein
VRQCDENCDDSCDNSRIYISNLPPDVTTEELRELFGGIGQVIYWSFLFYSLNLRIYFPILKLGIVLHLCALCRKCVQYFYLVSVVVLRLISRG